MKRTTDSKSRSPFSRREFFTNAAAVPGPRLLAAEDVDAAKGLGLKITGLKTFVVETGSDSDENYVFAKIYTNKGIVGLGEGTTMPPTKPGLGIELNEKEAARYPYQPKHWESFSFPDGAIHDR